MNPQINSAYFLMPVLLFAGAVAHAQIRYVPGYFISTSGTRTECLIRNVGWLNNPAEFQYRLADNGAEQTGGLSDVKEFGVAGTRYVNATVKIDTSSQSLKTLGTSKYPEWDERQVFLKVIAEGAADLFEYRARGLERYFYSVEGDPIEQLVYKQYRVNATEVGSNLMYLQQLKTAVSCGNVSDASLRKIRYEKNALDKYFRAYNACRGESVASAPPKKRMRFTITPGVDFAEFKVDNDNGFTKDYTKETSFRLGLMLEYTLSFNRGKWSIIGEPTFQNYRSGSSVRYGSIEIPLGLRHYFFVGPRAALFVNGFVVSDLPVKYVVTWSQTLTYKANFPSLSFAAGAGVRFGKFSIEGRKYFTRSVLDDADRFFFVYNKASVGLGYTIK